MTSEKSFGQVIREARQKLGMSQKDLAAQIKKENGEPISPQYQNDIEFDRRDPPADNMIKRYAEVLKLDHDILIFLAGRLPSDIQKIASENPEEAKKIAQAFRRKRPGST